MKATDEAIFKGPTVFYDGMCGFCNGAVQFILRHDRKGKFLFVTLQSVLAEELLKPHGLRPDALETTILLYRGKLYLRSSMGLKTGMLLGGWLWFSVVGYAVPGFIRDAVYNWFARNRYGWFGEAKSCRLPRPEERARMLA